MNVRFHHAGVACEDLDKDAEVLRLIGGARAGAPFVDEAQGVRGQFVELSGLRVELLEQLPGSRVLQRWLGTPARVYHLAFETDDIESSLAQLRDLGGVIVSPATPAPAFGGRHVGFVMLPGMFLVELIGGGVET